MTGPMRAERRIVFQGLGSLGVAAALAGCGSGTDGDAGGADGADGADGSGDGATAEPGSVLATIDEVPVGGGVVLSEQEIVVTQPSQGEFRAFTAVCTHQGCLVSTPTNGSIPCACHGSRFDAATGEVSGGPAPSPLSEIAVTVEGDEILMARAG